MLPILSNYGHLTTTSTSRLATVLLVILLVQPAWPAESVGPTQSQVGTLAVKILKGEDEHGSVKNTSRPDLATSPREIVG